MADVINLNLRVVLAAKGITMRDLAEETGYSHGHIRNVCCGSITSQKTQQKIEEALGMKIWSDPEIKAAAEQCSHDQEGEE